MRYNIAALTFPGLYCADGSELKPAGAPTWDIAACDTGRNWDFGLGMMPRRRLDMGVGCAGTLQASEAGRPWSDLTGHRAIAGVYWKIAQSNRREVG